MPQSTDLVTDLPADFEVFGQAVATSMADLLGGTTGQVLSKTTDADMDFTWVAANPGDITAVTAGTGISGGGTSGAVTITNSMATEITAKGDLIVGTGSATFDNLAAGANGSTIVADSAATTGLRYSATPSASNPVLNSAMQVWQRGTSFTGTTTAFGPDRWQVYRNTTGSTFSRQVTGDTTNLPNIQYAVRGQRDSGNTAVNVIQVTQNFESINSIPFAGKTITVSFYARAGANYSSASSILKSEVYTGTGTDQNIYSGFTGVATVANNSLTLTTTWQRFSASMSIGSTATQIAMIFGYTPVGTAGAADYFDLTGVQIDIGSVALPFRTYAATIQGELAACQRYYTRINAGSVYTFFCNGNAYNTTIATCLLPLPVTLRVSATSIDTSGTASHYRLINGSTATACSAVPALDQAATQSVALNFTVASGLTTGQAISAGANNTASAYIGVNAEL